MALVRQELSKYRAYYLDRNLDSILTLISLKLSHPADKPIIILLDHRFHNSSLGEKIREYLYGHRLKIVLHKNPAVLHRNSNIFVSAADPIRLVWGRHTFVHHCRRNNTLWRSRKLRALFAKGLLEPILRGHLSIPKDMASAFSAKGSRKLRKALELLFRSSIERVKSLELVNTLDSPHSESATYHAGHLATIFASSNTLYQRNTPYLVHSAKASRLIRRPLDEAVSAAKLLKHSAGKRRIKLFLSGGVDSQAMAQAFIAAKVPFTAEIVSFSDGLNQFDIQNAISFCKTNRLDYVVQKFNLQEFYFSGEYLPYAHKYRVISPQFCAHLAWIQRGDPNFKYFNVFSGNPPFGLDPCGRILALLPKDLFLCYERFFLKTQHQGCGLFFFYTRELLRSFLLTEAFVQALDSKRPITPYEYYLIKCRAYNDGGLEVSPMENKFTGFERVREHFDSLLNETDSFNKNYRVNLESFWGTSETFISDIEPTTQMRLVWQRHVAPFKNDRNLSNERKENQEIPQLAPPDLLSL